jgi:hypothetical protein
VLLSGATVGVRLEEVILQMRIECVIAVCNLYMWKREVLTLFSNFALSLTLICAVSSVVEANTQIVDASLDFR